MHKSKSNTIRLVQTSLFAFLISFLGTNLTVAQTLGPEYLALTELNRIKALQNPQFERSEEIFNSNILDNKNHVVGKVIDLQLLTSNGMLDSVKIELNNMRLNQNLYLNDSLLQNTVGSGYVVGLQESEIENLYPALLAETRPAAGEDNTVSLEILKNAEIHAEDGRILGDIEDVLFNQRRNKAEALYISMKYDNLRGQSFAIPFTMADYTGLSKSKRTVSVSNQAAEAILTFAEQR